jgi:predicted Zn finger-like uncharacterized protein
VIVDCESCHTRFRLDEKRIPATGAKVRCSRCKAAFIVHRPNVNRDELVDEVVAEATDPGASSAPAATADLFDTSSPGAALGEDGAERGPEASSDEKWEFDEPPPPSAPHARSSARSADAAPDSAPPNAEDLGSLGSPDGWDLIGDTRAMAAEARFEATPAPAHDPAPAPPRPVAHAPERASDAPPPSVDRFVAAAAAAAARVPEPAAAGWRGALRAAAQACIDSSVWVASVALCSVGLALALSPPKLSSASPEGVIAGSLAGRDLALARHRLESAVGGEITIVRGRLPAGAVVSPSSRLRATWRDAQGGAIGSATAIAGPPLSQRELREYSLERLRAQHAARALELTAGGPFEAVFGDVPPGASDVELQLEAVPVEPAAATQPEESAEGTSATPPAPMTSSRPTARPSSE